MRTRLETLDGMRGVAALLVALYHFQQRQELAVIPGYLAVDLFFVLSGFVIARAYTQSLNEGLSAGRFMIFRLIRLYPLYATGTLLGMVYAVGAMLGITLQILPSTLDMPGAMTAGEIGWAAMFSSLLLPTPFETSLFPFNGAAWSLFFELLINLAFALALWRARSRYLLLLMALSMITLAYEAHPPLFFNTGWRLQEVVPGAARVLYSFPAGVLIFRHLRLGILQASVTSLLPIVLMVVFVVVPVPVVWRGIWEMLVVTLGFPAIVALAASLEPARALRKPFQVLGTLSYPLYAIHWPLAAIMKPALAPLPEALGASVFLAVSLGVAGGAARWIDTPIRAWMLHKLSARALPSRSSATA